MKIKVTRRYAGCYLLTSDNDEVYVERSIDDPKLWSASNAETKFNSYAEAKAYAITVMTGA